MFFKTTISMIALMGLSFPITAQAEELQLKTDRPPSLEAGTTPNSGEKWEVTLGGGAAVRPTFEGSDEYTVSPIPFVNVVYDDTVSIGANGVEIYERQENFRVGVGLTYDGGREDSEENGIFSTGDDRLEGLGDIEGALGIRASGAYDFGWINAGLSVTKFTGDENDGLIADAEISRGFPISEKFMLRPYLGATWADENYMQTFFGVTEAQASASSFSQYDAEAGIKNISAGIDGRYAFDSHWFVNGRADVKAFTGDAADSPITFSDTNAMFLTMVGYKF